MGEKIKLTNEDLKEVKELQSKFSKLAQDLGGIEFQIMGLELQKEQIKYVYSDLDRQGKELDKKFTYKYGVGVLNTTTGEFEKQNEVPVPPQDGVMTGESQPKV